MASADQERRRQMKAFFKSIKGTSQFDPDAYAKFGFSESEDEAPPAGKVKTNGSKESGRPAGAKELGPEGPFEVVHTRVMFRSAAETAAAVRMVAKKGTRVWGAPFDVDGNPWLLLSQATCRELKLDGGDAWVLMDGRNIGLGELMRPVQEEAAPASVEPSPEAVVESSEPAEKRVSILNWSVTGAAIAACNGVFAFEGNHKGKALYKSSTGAILYFNGVWRISSTYKVTSSNYNAKGLSGESGPMPPLGRWIADGSGKLGPVVRVTGESLRVASEKGSQLKLEDGRTVTKGQENKTWCWTAVLQEMEAAGSAQAVQLEKQKEKALEAVKVEPPPRDDIKTLANPLWAFEQRVAKEAEAAGEELLSMEALLSSIDAAEEADEAPDAAPAATSEAAVPSIDDLLKKLDNEEEEQAASSDAGTSRDLFFELGRKPTTAIMTHGGAAAASWNAQLHGGVTSGRGSQFNFMSLREMGAAMAHEMQASSSTTS